MKKIFILLINSLLFFNCLNRKDINNVVNKNGLVDLSILEKAAIKREGKSPLKIIDKHQEILLRQRDDKCGEWGGDTKEIRVYKSKSNENIFVDYKKTIMNCNDPYYKKTNPNIFERKGILLKDSEINLIQESIMELLVQKLTTNTNLIGSKVNNYVLSKDSTLIIVEKNYFSWLKFLELIEKIENK